LVVNYWETGKIDERSECVEGYQSNTAVRAYKARKF